MGFTDALEVWELNKWNEKTAPVFRHKLSMFLAGLIMLTPHRIAILCANHVVARFHLPPSVVPLFIYKVHNPMELSSFIGQLLSTTMTLIIDRTGQDLPQSQSKRVLSCIFIWAMFFSCVLAYIFFVTGDDYGHFDQFYWCIILITFSNGLFANYAFGTNFNSALYGAGLPLSGFFTFVFHKICVWVSKVRMWDDFDYSIVEKQIFWINISLLFTAGWWTFDQYCQFDKTIAGKSDIKELFSGGDAGDQWSPVLMLGFSLGTVYFFYPSISPYQFVDWNTAEQIDLWIVVVSSIPTLLIAVFDEIDNFKDHEWTLGPGGTGPGNYGNKEINDKGAEITLNDANTEMQLVGSNQDQAHANPSGKVVEFLTNQAIAKGHHDATTQKTANDINTQLTNTAAKQRLKEAHTQLATLSTATQATAAKSAAEGAVEKLNDAKGQLTAGTHDKAIEWINALISKYEGIGKHMDPDKAVPKAQNWNNKAGKRWWWHLIGWISGVPYMICMYIFISILHFPDGRISKFIYSRPKLLWIIPITFNTVEELMEIVSFSGAGKQSTKANMYYNGAVGQFNGVFFYSIMNISISLGINIENCLLYYYEKFEIRMYDVIRGLLSTFDKSTT